MAASWQEILPGTPISLEDAVPANTKADLLGKREPQPILLHRVVVG